MTPGLQYFLMDTLVWTGVLIGIVLLVRRPVARHLGPQAAYALWFLPLTRLVFPPIVLPAWLRPAEDIDRASVSAQVTDAPALSAGMGQADGLAASIEPASSAGASALFSALSGLSTALFAIWLGGAVIYLVRRFSLYGVMRRELLAEARPVGESGSIRLVETPAIAGPVAFGVRDKVIALPLGFMASRDRLTRDLALEHEFAHHRGHDLLVNFLVQPLFALHWFNPLGWAGWRALRRDQEAACDARVVAARSRAERAAYADVIAEFACRSRRAPRAALAAPMACPVLGDKSIIHRLRSLTMTDVSPRRRIAARLAIGAAVLAMPLTASISYAEASPPAPPPPVEAPDAPAAPLAPPAPEAPLPPEVADVEADLAHAERQIADAQREIAELEDGKAHRVDDRTARVHRDLTAEERAELRAALAHARTDLDQDMADLRAELGENGKLRKEIRIAMAEARAAAPTVVKECRNEDEPVTSVKKDGRTVLYVCETYGRHIALKSLRSVREQIARDGSMPHGARAEALKSLDAEIADHAEN